ncbi:ABC transporter ATP-binding protein [Actinomycetospora sp. CA-053990]|uniref:ABC transporter ATP-binding protein n=1 Tax=Actinomycetospora sp. CA-053990 TaxID=3239891 RepID=UPI003D8B8322
MSAPEPREAVLTGRDIHRFFRVGGHETLALRGLSITVRRGEMVALVGPSGSGKSTLISCLAGLDRPDGGEIHLAGHRVTGVSETERCRLRARHLGVLRQSDNLVEHLSVAGNIAVAQALGDRPVRPEPHALLGDVGLASRAEARPSRLSGGEAARAALAVALANDPPVLVADEPTGELDGETEAQVLALLRDTVARGVGVLVASHSPAVAAAADRRVHLVDGAVRS